MRVGVAYGPATNRAGDWFGTTINLVSRVTSAARPGRILATEEVQTRTPEHAWKRTGAHVTSRASTTACGSTHSRRSGPIRMSDPSGPLRDVPRATGRQTDRTVLNGRESHGRGCTREVSSQRRRKRRNRLVAARRAHPASIPASHPTGVAALPARPTTTGWCACEARRSLGDLVNAAYESSLIPQCSPPWGIWWLLSPPSHAHGRRRRPIRDQ